MKQKILIISIVIIIILLFLQAPSFFDQSECRDCRSLNNWDWIEFELLHCWDSVSDHLNIETPVVWPSIYQREC